MLRVIPFLTLLFAPSLLSAQDALPDYKQWRLACAKLPTNRDLKGRFPDNKLLPLPAFTDFEKALDAFLKLEREGPLANSKQWVDDQPAPKVFFDFTRGWYGDKDVPFQHVVSVMDAAKKAGVQRLAVAAQRDQNETPNRSPNSPQE